MGKLKSLCHTHVAALSVLTAGLLILLSSGCYDSTAGMSVNRSGSRQKLVLTGSSTVAPLLEDIGRQFESLQPNVRVDVQTGGSSRGISDAKNEVAVLGMASRELKQEEQEGLISHHIATDGICMIVHRDNPIQNLSTEQIRDIYRGKIKDWSHLEGSENLNGNIVVINKAEGRGTLEVFLKHTGMAVQEVNAHLIAGDNQQVIKSITSNPQAIGYVSFGAADHAAHHHSGGGKIKMLKLDGVEPTIENIRTGQFSMTRPLLLISKGQPTGMASRLVNFARSEAAHNLVQGHYFVPAAD